MIQVKTNGFLCHFIFFCFFVVCNNLSALKKKELSLCNVKRTFCQISPNPPCVTVSAWKSHGVVSFIWQYKIPKGQATLFKVRKIAPHPCLGIFMNKSVFNLTSTINSALFRVFLLNSFKTKTSRKSWGNKVLHRILTTHTELLMMYRPTNACQLPVSCKTQMRKTTVHQVMEGLKSECRGDLRVAAEMSNQTLLWASSTDQSQCNQA